VRLENFIVVSLICYFLSKSVYLAFSLAPGMAPDEIFHIQLIELYAKSNSLFPFYGSSNVFDYPLPEYLRFGPTTEYPAAYHMILGKLAKLFKIDPTVFSSIVLFRLINTIISCANLLCIFSLFRSQLSSVHGRILAYVICTNLLTYTLLAGSVSYDPSVNLISTIATLILIKYLKTRQMRLAIYLIGVLSLGITIKWTVLPFAVICAAFGAMAFFSNKTDKTWRRNFEPLANKLSLLLISFLMGIIATASLLLIASKFYKYGKLMPSCTDIYSVETCKTFEASTIFFPPQNELSSILLYPLHWLFYMIQSAFGIKSFIGVTPPLIFSIMIEVILIWGFLLSLWKFNRQNDERRLLTLLPIIYCSVFFWVWGFPTYKEFLNAEYGVNGRYAFPVLASITMICSEGCLMLLSGWRKTLTTTLLCLFLIYWEFPTFLTSKAGQAFLSYPSANYYRLLPYYPNPVYDESFKQI
jgi:hypothetical protein